MIPAREEQPGLFVCVRLVLLLALRFQQILERIVLVVAITLGIETKSLLVGEGANDGDLNAIIRAIEDGPEIEKLIHIKTLYLGPDEILVAAKLGFPADKPLIGVASDIDAVEARVRAAVPAARVLYFEPDVFRPVAGDGPPTDAVVLKSAD